MGSHWTLKRSFQGTFFWDYSVDSYSGIRITEHTEYQFPKEQTLCYSENRIADVTKIKAMRPRKSGYAIFPPKDGRKLPKEHDYRLFCLFRTNRYSVNSAIGSRIDGILFRSFQNQNRSQKNTITANSVYSHSGIVPKEHALSYYITAWITFTCMLILCSKLLLRSICPPSFRIRNTFLEFKLTGSSTECPFVKIESV